MQELTKKETEIYNAICEKGLTKVAELMDNFKVSKSTIKSHLAHIYEKTLVNSIAELIYRHYNRKEK